MKKSTWYFNTNNISKEFNIRVFNSKIHCIAHRTTTTLLLPRVVAAIKQKAAEMLNATWWNGANTPIVHRAALTTSPGCTETDPQGRFKHLVSWAGRHPARCPQPAQMTSSFSFQPGLSLSTLPCSSLSCSLQVAASAAQLEESL